MAERYVQEVLPTKAPSPQEGNLRELKRRTRGCDRADPSRKVMGLGLINKLDDDRMTKYQLGGAMDRARAAAAKANPDLADDIRNFQFRDLRAKATTDTDEELGISAAQQQLGRSTPR